MIDMRNMQKPIAVGDRVMIHMPQEATGKAWKLARAFHGPFRVLNVTPTNVEARLVDDPDSHLSLCLGAESDDAMMS